MKLTPSQVKNLMRRGLRLLLDPDPSKAEKDLCREHFGHACAYCGVIVKPGKGDFDHLVSASRGGLHHISNRVYSCKPCNAKEKREADWQEFLKLKCSGKVLSSRKKRIFSWATKNAGSVPRLSKATLRVLEAESDKATKSYERACKKVIACA